MNGDLKDLEDVLRHNGLGAGLMVLNQRVVHRFTAVFKLDGAVMRNIAIVDKRREVVPDSFKEIPFEDSFCQFVLRDGSFITENSQGDKRLDAHVYQGVLNSYVGLPLTTSSGDLFGTLCHFDFPPVDLSDEEFQFLNEVVKVLPHYVAP